MFSDLFILLSSLSRLVPMAKVAFFQTYKYETEHFSQQD